VQRVTDFGGFFFRARDPDRLAHWYLAHLGIRLTGADYEDGSWRQAAGPTVFQPFPADTDYFDRPDGE
jgi:hypothetical protein